MMRALVGLALLLVLAGCAEQETGTLIEMKLDNNAITMDRTEVPAGLVTFNIENLASQLHEIEVFGGATPGMALEVINDIGITTGLDIVDEEEGIVGGMTAQLTVDLEPGTYLIICNMPGHYAQGMTIELTVTSP